MFNDIKHISMNLFIAIKHYLNLETGLILTMSQEDELLIEGKAIKVIPVWKWLVQGLFRSLHLPNFHIPIITISSLAGNFH